MSLLELGCLGDGDGEQSLALGGRATWEEHPTQGWRVGGHWGSAIQGSSSAWP